MWEALSVQPKQMTILHAPAIQKEQSEIERQKTWGTFVDDHHVLN